MISEKCDWNYHSDPKSIARYGSAGEECRTEEIIDATLKYTTASDIVEQRALRGSLDPA